MRLIDADELERVFIGKHYGVNAIKYFIEMQPAIDAMPVKHGRWVSEDALFGGVPFYCSECGFRKHVSDERRYKYCPNCGSYMKYEDGDAE